MPATDGDPQRPLRFGPALFILSTAVLAQELLLVRLIAFPLWHHVTYMVVTTALLAFGVAGTLAAIWPGLVGRDRARAPAAFARNCALFAILTPAIPWAIRSTGLDTVQILARPGLLVPLFLLYVVVGLPILFAGLAVTGALRHAGPRLSRAYFANLLGSGAGCVLFLAALRPLGGPGLLLATGILGATAGLLAGPRGRSASANLGLGLLLLLGMALPPLGRLLVPEALPVPSKELRRHLEQGHRIETTRWDPLCRIDVTGPPPGHADRTKLIFQDADALTFLYPGDGPEAGETLVPYIVHPGLRSILVIGAGGGRELTVARRRGVPRILGLEINGSTVDLLHGPYYEFTGGLVDQPGVELLHAEGRSYLARHAERFDFIQMTGVDTYAALNSGAYVASESYLYTADAFDAYLDHLEPGGYLSIIRLFFSDRPDRETLRLFVMALDALKRRGAPDPGRHAIVVRSDQWGILVVGRDPVPPAAVQAVRDALSAEQARRPTEEARGRVNLQHDPEADLGTPFSRFAEALRDGTTAAFFAAYPYNVRPIPDDRPFFYLYHEWGSVLRNLLGLRDEASEGQGLHRTVFGRADPWLANTGQIPAGQVVLLALLVQSLVFGAVLVAGPLLVFRRRALRLPGAGRAAIHVTALGLGFMLLEIALAQKLTLFLGHPTRSLAVVIGGMLVFSGLGSLASGLLPARRAGLLGCAATALGAGLLTALLPAITVSWLAAEDSVRVALVLLLVAPLSFAMGMPMPSALRLISARGADFLPWAWATNGVASVFASVFAIVLAMATSFTGVLIAAAGLYLIALLTRPRPA